MNKDDMEYLAELKDATKETPRTRLAFPGFRHEIYLTLIIISFFIGSHYHHGN